MLSLLDQDMSIYACASTQMKYFLRDLLWAKFLSFCIEGVFFLHCPKTVKATVK